ncbi:acetyl-CoA carboxylase biotin carboxylase subunit [Noviherbaspirillum sp. Root189]|uniref:acetyl-CoA carboxylase biotin carboxylase subunit n=1 Tax=Noviherbaspirillum sp. Root189 TaxID=1736487 RepID=UPI0007093529|nr:biotin carboxylase N-terminal domain-containing protein [Noviherbaspirillum sp. Root189]KRB67985.1 biotin carboxylase [Noviherbaspirillum sp. Root189]
MRRILVANRGAVAARVIRAVHALGLQAVAVYSDADAGMPYLTDADAAMHIGEAAPMASYLNQDAILAAAAKAGADAIHPGYGFLSENAGFAERVERAEMCFIGPSSHWIRDLGQKTHARELMAEYGMPMTRASRVLDDDPAAVAAVAREMGYPLLLKPGNGGGGIGMLPVRNEEEVEAVWNRARSVASKSFGSAQLYFEHLLEQPRHIEFQFLADRYGGVRCLFERDCSTQRRHQKVLEEAPAPALPREQLDAMAAQLQDILGRIGYDIIGTVEMLYTPERGFSFLEVNTRLQVEHAVTEEVTGIDIVAAQIRLARGERINDVLPATPALSGHAIEARVYAEDPVRFFPSPGLLEQFDVPSGLGIRIETGYAEGCRVSSYYDPMLAKVIASGADRPQAIARLVAALDACSVRGVKTNIPFIQRVLASRDFRDGAVHTGLAESVLRSA